MQDYSEQTTQSFASHLTRRHFFGRGSLGLGTAALAGLLAAFAGCRPTGQVAVDVVLVAALGVLTTWLAASAKRP